MNLAAEDVSWSGVGRWRRLTVVLLLTGPVALMLAVPVYARAEPSLAGVPFFYWFQFAGVPFSMVSMWLALLLLRGSLGRADSLRGTRG